MQIIFGTKKLTESTRAISVEKYEGRAVVTVESQKGAKKSRRILFNTTASQLLGLEPGSVQQLVFAPIQDTRQVLIANLETIDEDARGEMVTYRTSKNKVSYGEETTEKGKASTTSFMCKELFSFFGKHDAVDLEFELNEFESDSLEAFSLDLIEELHPDLNLDFTDLNVESEEEEEEQENIVQNTNEEEDFIEDEIEDVKEEIPTVDKMVEEFQGQEDESTNVEPAPLLERRTLIS